jgi:Ras-related protein Rab-6A
LWDTGGMERVASITSSYYKFAEAAILVFSLDNAASFHILSQHLLEIVTYAENAKIFLCGNKSDLETISQVTDADMEAFWYSSNIILLKNLLYVNYYSISANNVTL